jgi:hypothetical protein
MRVAHISVYVQEGSVLRPDGMLRESGEPWGWLDVGEQREVAVFGSPGALRRLAAALVIAAEHGEELAGGGASAPRTPRVVVES